MNAPEKWCEHSVPLTEWMKLEEENRQLRDALTEAAQAMRNMSHLSAKYRTMLMAHREPK